MYICLMRHGKAEAYTAKKEDRDRELIEKGRRQAATMAQAALHWWPDGLVALWTSPYVRAWQTADILKEQVSPVTYQRHPAIATGDLTAFYADVLTKATEDIICVVGHSPSLDQWAERWTGTPIDFKTGSMALFDYDVHGGPVGSASLLCYVQPKGAALFHY